MGALTTFEGLEELCAWLREQGCILYRVGGAIKGSPAQYLEQASTRAREVPVSFVEGTYAVPGCYYEMARRYPMPDGQLFDGFLPTSADKIFHSTDVL